MTYLFTILLPLHVVIFIIINDSSRIGSFVSIHTYAHNFISHRYNRDNLSDIRKYNRDNLLKVTYAMSMIFQVIQCSHWDKYKLLHV